MKISYVKSLVDEDKKTSYVIPELAEELNPHMVHVLPLLESKPEEVGSQKLIWCKARMMKKMTQLYP